MDGLDEREKDRKGKIKRRFTLPAELSMCSLFCSLRPSATVPCMAVSLLCRGALCGCLLSIAFTKDPSECKDPMSWCRVPFTPG